MKPDLIDNTAARTVKVSSSTTPSELAHALSAMLRQGDNVVIEAIGHGAVGQATKAVPILNTMTINAGMFYVVAISLRDIKDDNQQTKTVTCMRLLPWRVGG